MTQKELGYIELEWTCKHCGTINPGMQRVCTNCGAPIGQDDKFELPDQQELITDKQKLEEAKEGPAIQCPYCNVFNPAGTKLCIQCGGDIQEGLSRKAGEVLGAFQTTAVPDKPCPFCNQPVKANAQRCPHCGGSLVESIAPTTAITPAKPKKTPVWLIIGGIAIGALCLVSIITFIVMSGRTKDVTATVADLHWERSIGVIAQQPVQKSAWREDLPGEAQNVSCQDEYKETSSNPVPSSTEVCGTPYTIDVGSGAGKVVQDCEYRVYASYCDFTVLDWVLIDTVVAQGNDSQPEWPVTHLQAGQEERERIETYQVTFEADGQKYLYTTVDPAEFGQFSIDTQWVLSINGLGDIKAIQGK